MAQRRGIGRIIISSLAGFIVFLILLGIANLFILTINNPVYSAIVRFFNTNLAFLILLTFIGLINEIFWNLYFPFVLIAPISSSIFSVFLLMFFERFWIFLRELLNIGDIIPFQVLYILIPLIVLIAGYITIIARLGKRKIIEERKLRRYHDKRTDELKEEVKELKKRVDNIHKEDVGDDFKTALNNLGKSINKLVEDKKKDKKRQDRNKKRKR